MISAGGTIRQPRAAPPGARTIIRLRGALDIDGAPALREHLIDMVHRAAGLLVLDLSLVLSCDASGLAVLIGTQRRARLRGIRVCLTAPSPAVAKVLRSSGLDRSFNICQDLSSAIAPGLDAAGKSPQPRLGAAAPFLRGCRLASPGSGLPVTRASCYSLSS
jgi:anti-anti-sigma factor